MKKVLEISIIAGLIALSAAVAGCRQADGDERKLIVAHATWIGYGPLYIAQDQGLFRKAGLDVDLRVIEASSDAIAAMQGGRVDMVASTVDNFTLFAGNGADVTLLAVLGESAGGDGIVAKNDIKTLTDLKGRSVAVQMGSISQFILSEALDRAGLTLADVRTIDMKSGDAGAAFAAGSVDAAVTWQPWLSKAAASGGGKVLIDTRAMPGLVVDALATRREVAHDRAADMKAFVGAYFAGVDFMNKNPEAAKRIIARHLKIDLAALNADFDNVRFYDRAQNAAFFAGDDSRAARLMSRVGKFYHQSGALRTLSEPGQLIGTAPEIMR